MEDDAGRNLDRGLTRAEWLLLLVLAGIQFTHSMDFMIMMPLGPECREELGITPQQFALVVGSYGFSAALAGLFATWFIDRYDRKTSLLSLYSGLTVGTFLCAVAPGYWWLVLARSVAGAFGGIGGAFILVIVGDSFPEIRRGRATGVVMTAFSVASIAGLPAGIVLGNNFGAQTPSWASSVRLSCSWHYGYCHLCAGIWASVANRSLKPGQSLSSLCTSGLMYL